MSSSLILAHDLGTGGNKASIYDADGRCLGESFAAYETRYPESGRHEQRPDDWWDAVVRSTRTLLKDSSLDSMDVSVCALSGHSLGVVPLDSSGALLKEWTPIWSDARATKQAARFFDRITEKDWYETTGNGFPPPLYSVFKVMWMKENEPDVYEKTRKILGTKDYINYRLTGEIATDHSYASGSGVYDLKRWRYSDDLIKASGIRPDLFPDPIPSHEIVGSILPDAAQQLGLRESVPVVAGGVDNSCMALGARNLKEGRTYNSLGSSSWIAVSGSEPIIELGSRPFVFAHVVPGLYTSALSVFAAGTSLRWVRDNVCPDLIQVAHQTGQNVYDLMTDEAAKSPPGSRGLLFNPSLAGGTSLDPTPHIRGAWVGLEAGHSRADLIRSALEGVAMGLRVALDELGRLGKIDDVITVVGGGSESRLWRRILANVFNMQVLKTNVGEQAAALGAAATGAVGVGLWNDFSRIDAIHETEDCTTPDPQDSAVYASLMPVYRGVTDALGTVGKQIRELGLS